ncbi:MAG: hypothetical protein MPJ78_19945 [Hyphomicrobiaceae bacterium]|nr:hypothetical protein [Hyphomicrobiaceae bacterium]
MVDLVSLALDIMAGRNFTVDLEDSKILNFDNREDRLYMFRRHSKNEQPVYVHATMNGGPSITVNLLVEYARLLDEGEEPSVGRWIDGNTASLEAGLAVDDGMDDDGIRRILAEYEQQYAAKLTPIRENGNIVDVEVDYVERRPG